MCHMTNCYLQASKCTGGGRGSGSFRFFQLKDELLIASCCPVLLISLMRASNGRKSIFGLARRAFSSLLNPSLHGDDSDASNAWVMEVPSCKDFWARLICFHTDRLSSNSSRNPDPFNMHILSRCARQRACHSIHPRTRE